MPTRLIREGILSSDKVNLLDWPAEIFYRRLLNKVDDHGLYDARPSILRTSLYPLKVNKVKEKDCLQWLDACRKAGLVVIYQKAGKWYLQVLNTCWNARSDPKYPLPTENSCKQLQTTENIRTVVVYVDVNKDVYVDDSGAQQKSEKPAALHKINGDESPILAKLPLRGGGEFEVRQAWVAELEPSYPDVKVVQTILEMKGWCLGNPDRMKTRKGIKRFITSWLQNEQEKGDA